VGPPSVTLERKPSRCRPSINRTCSFDTGIEVRPNRAFDAFWRCEHTCARLTSDMACRYRMRSRPSEAEELGGRRGPGELCRAADSRRRLKRERPEKEFSERRAVDARRQWAANGGWELRMGSGVVCAYKISGVRHLAADQSRVERWRRAGGLAPKTSGAWRGHK
jgi:hypothetical protein